MEAMDSATACTLAGDESLLLSCRRSPRARLFRSVVGDIDRAVTHFNGELIDEGTLVGVLRDRLGALEALTLDAREKAALARLVREHDAALEQLAQVEVPSEASSCSC